MTDEAAVDAAEEHGPDISMTDPAIDRLKMLVESAGEPPVSGIRLQITRRNTDGFEHLLTMVDASQEPEDDYELDFDGLALFVEAENAEYLDGIAVHWEFKGDGVNGFEFDNPNPLWHDPIALRIQQLLDADINPGIASHGGFVDLVSVEGSIAYIRLGGGCQGCGLADVTLKQGIEVAIKDAVPEIEQVADATDHAAGTDPYFQPSKK